MVMRSLITATAMVPLGMCTALDASMATRNLVAVTVVPVMSMAPDASMATRKPVTVTVRLMQGTYMDLDAITDLSMDMVLPVR
jgi:hypothetical protein